MEPSALQKRKKRGLILLLVATVLVVAAIVLVVAYPSLTAQKAHVELTAEPQYLQYQNTSSGIYLVSATAKGGAFPLSDVIPPHPDDVVPTPTPIIRNGDSCIIVNVTLRSDYTLSNLSPNQFSAISGNGTAGQTPADYAYVFLTAKLYDKAGQEISAVDVTPPYGHPNGGAVLLLHNGETDSIAIYLSTDRTDIDHFTVEARYIGALPLP